MIAARGADEFWPHAGGAVGSAMSTNLQFDQIRLPPECEKLRAGSARLHRRGSRRRHLRAGPARPRRHATIAHSASRVGAKGWIGMTWPKKYGGHERNFLERYVVTEEFRVANAPVRLHFVADRQSGPILLKYAPEHIKQDILPRICRGELCFVIGMSEPNSGSDLFAAKSQGDQGRRRLEHQRHRRSGPATRTSPTTCSACSAPRRRPRRTAATASRNFWST